VTIVRERKKVGMNSTGSKGKFKTRTMAEVSLKRVHRGVPGGCRKKGEGA